jgi:hypothetical protein
VGQVLDGTLRLVEDVLVERYADHELVVLSRTPARCDEMLALNNAVDGRSRVDARVTESDPVFVDGALRHRLRLDIVPRASKGDPPPLIGSFVRTLPVRLVEISEGGCLLEAPMPVEHGTRGELQVVVGETFPPELLRICRCQLVRGTAPLFRAGAEFLNGIGLTTSLRVALLAKAEHSRLSETSSP